jgi:glyceraldehyde-3-phosphate dehydrogenase/erythrose-4-phosphate dehydrogenase
MQQKESERVPVTSGSITDIVLNLRKEVTRDEINEALREADNSTTSFFVVESTA